MQYWEVVTRSFRISWNHKYLWLIALLIVWLLFVIAFFILAAVCEGATVRASAEHDADRPFGLRLAWRVGVATMWVIVRFRLLIIALGLPVTIAAIGLGVGIVLSFVNNNFAAGFGLIGLAVLLAILAIPYAIYLFFLDRLGSRALVREHLRRHLPSICLDRRRRVLEQFRCRRSDPRARVSHPASDLVDRRGVLLRAGFDLLDGCIQAARPGPASAFLSRVPAAAAA